MAGTTTTYRVEAVYDLTDKASRQLEEIGKHAKQAAHHSEGLKAALFGVAEAFGAMEVVRKAKEYFVDFNQQVEDAHIALTAMIESNFDVSFDKAGAAAQRMYDHFQKFSMQTPVTTKQILEFSRGITVAASNTGASIAEITKMSEMGVIAGKVLGGGHDTGYLTGELSHMLAGNINQRMQFARNLLGSIHMSEKQFKALSAEKRKETVLKALDSPAMRDAAKAYGDSFSGVTSTLEDKLQIFLGKVGVPLFKAITKEVAEWNKWLEKNKNVIEVYINRAGEVLKDGFGHVRDAFAFIAQHAGTLIKVAEAYAAIKIGSAIGGGLASSIGSVGGLGGKVKGAAGLGGVAGLLVGVGTASYMATRALMDYTGATEALKRKIDPHAAQLDIVTNRLKDFEVAIAHTRDSMNSLYGENDARSTGKYASIDPYVKQQMEKVEALRNMQGADSMVRQQVKRTGYEYDTSGLEKAGFTGADARKYAGYTKDDLNKAANEIEAQARGKKQEYDAAAAGSNAIVKTEMARMTAAQKEAINWAKVQAEILTAILSGKKLDVGQIEKDAGSQDDAMRGKKEVPQNVNIYINQVSAKDPDRWLADIDDMAAKRAGAPTRARSALARGM